MINLLLQLKSLKVSLAMITMLFSLMHPQFGGVSTTTPVTSYTQTTSQAEASSTDYIGISKLNFVGTHTSGTLTYQITSTESMPDGVIFFARAWKNGTQLGFGKDGTTDLERFRIHKPGLLLASSTGSIVSSTSTPTVRYTYNPQGALLSELEQTILVAGKTGTNIVPGSIGHTTDTFFSGPGDGMAQASGSTSWATTHSTVTGITSDYTTTLNGTAGESYNGTNYEILRHFYPIDTSSLPDTDVVSSATFTVYTQSWTGTAENVGIVQTTQASETQLANADFSKCGATTNPTEGATRLTPSGTDTTANNFTLNATGLGWVSLTGYTNLGMRTADDMDNTDPGLSPRHYFQSYDSDQAGTSLDPTLVVVHAAPATASAPIPQEMISVDE